MARNLELVVETQPEHRKDIAIYIQDKLKDKEGHNVEKLEMMAKGIFMWIILVIEIINRDFDEGITTNIETTFNSSLDDVFLTLLEKNNRRRDQTILMLQWVLFAYYPLAPDQLYFAVMSGTDGDQLRMLPPTDSSKYTKFITTTSKGLLEIRENELDGKVRFIHESVRDFLLRNNRMQLLDPLLGPYTVTMSHDRLVDCCLSYIDMVPLQNNYESVVDSMKTRYPFLFYATHHLFFHAKNACERSVFVEPSLHRFLDDHTLFLKFKRLNIYLYIYDEDISDNVELLFILCMERCVELVRTLLQFRKHSIDINSRNGGLGTALDLTLAYISRGEHRNSKSDYCDIATMLIEAGTSVSNTQALELEQGRQKLLSGSWTDSEDEGSQDETPSSKWRILGIRGYLHVPVTSSISAGSVYRLRRGQSRLPL
jgi:hypothetical protein